MHEPFLERASSPNSRFRPHALGAFLTLRAVDRVIEGPGSLPDQALAYQLKACTDYLDELHPQNEEVSHLREIVRLGRKVSESSSNQLLWSPLLAYAYWLEQQLRLSESLDVLENALRLKNDSSVEQRVAANLQRGRVLRLTGRFSESHMAYAAAGELANLSGDWRSEMVSRIGRATNLQKTGDLPASEVLLRNVLAAAGERKDDFIESRALHGLAMSMHLMNRLPNAVTMALQAYHLYEETIQRARALSDIGMFLKEQGHYGVAKEAFLLVLQTEPTPEIRVNTVLELFELASLVQDRVGFARWRRELESGYESLPPAEQLDFEIKLGSGLAGFGRQRDGRAHLERAVALAQSHGFGQRLFEAERLLEELRAGRPVSVPPPTTSEVFPELQQAIEGLYALRS